MQLLADRRKYIGGWIEGFLWGCVSSNAILDYIRQTFDMNAESFVTPTDYTGKSDFERSRRRRAWEGHLYFYDCVRDRELYYSYAAYRTRYKREFYSKFCPNAEIKPDVTYVSINVGDSSTGIIEKIVTNFGGWISVT